MCGDLRDYPMRVVLLLSMSLTACDQEKPVADTQRQTAQINAPRSATPLPELVASPVLTASGFGTIRIGGKPTDASNYDLASSDEAGEACRIFLTPRVPGLSVMVEHGVITRISAFTGKNGPPRVRTERGIGVGSSEDAVRAAYRPLGETPHKYKKAPAKNLVFGEEGVPQALRFEIGSQGKVIAVHAGESPALMYAKGCS